MPRWAEAFYEGYGAPLFHYYASLSYYTTSIFTRLLGTNALDSLRVLIALGMSPEQATQRARKFREHDEELLASQHLIYDDEAALLESAKQARGELEQLFEADIEPDDTDVSNDAP